MNVAFMAAFGIPITFFTVFLVASSHMLSQLFAITPGGVGQTQALDVATWAFGWTQVKALMRPKRREKKAPEAPAVPAPR